MLPRCHPHDGRLRRPRSVRYGPATTPVRPEACREPVGTGGADRYPLPFNGGSLRPDLLGQTLSAGGLGVHSAPALRRAFHRPPALCTAGPAPTLPRHRRYSGICLLLSRLPGEKSSPGRPQPGPYHRRPAPPTPRIQGDEQHARPRRRRSSPPGRNGAAPSPVPPAPAPWRPPAPPGRRPAWRRCGRAPTAR